MILVLVTAGALGALYGLAFPAIAAMLVVLNIANSLNLELSSYALLASLPVILLVPVAVASIARITERLALGTQLRTSVVPLALVAGAAIMLNSSGSIEALVSLLQSAAAKNHSALLLTVSGTITKGVALVLLISFLIAAIYWLCELPFLLIGQGLCNISMRRVLIGTRPLMLILVLCFVIETLIQIFIERL